MRFDKRWVFGMGVGAAIALGACGGGGDSTVDSGELANATANAANAATDSAGSSMGGAPGTGGTTSGMAGGEVDANAIRGLNEADVVALVGASNAGEIATSKVAVEKGTNADVKAFARRMIDEHQAMQREADQLAKAANLTMGSPQVATEKTRMGNEMTAMLTGAPAGPAFDRQYIDGQVMAHQRTLAELQAMQGGNLQNAQLRGMIEKSIPKVQAHLQEAQRLQGQLCGASGAGAAGAGAAGGMGGATGGAAGGAAGGTTGGAAGGTGGH